MLFLWVKHGAAIFLLCHSQWFNPGSENPELGRLAEGQGIGTLEACTLALLATGQY